MAGANNMSFRDSEKLAQLSQSQYLSTSGGKVSSSRRVFLSFDDFVGMIKDAFKSYA